MKNTTTDGTIEPASYSRNEAKAYLNVSLSTLQALYTREVIPSYKIGSRRFFRRADLAAYVASL